MFCKNCGEKMNDNKVACEKCGTYLGYGFKYCEQCGKPTDEETGACQDCGEVCLNCKKHVGLKNIDFCPYCGASIDVKKNMDKIENVESNEVKFCKNCGVKLNDKQAVCLKCGVKVGEGNSFCENCGNPVNANASVCLSCGVALGKIVVKCNSVNGYLDGHDKVSMALICFFLGSIGIHNFILGENKKGIFKIIMVFCFGVSLIFMLIDFVKILSDSYVIDKNALI